MNEMWAYVYEDGRVRKKRVPVPGIRTNDVLVKIDRVSICGSDFHIFNNDDWAKGTVPPGITIGHEGCGEIVETGSGVKGLKVGDYVALESHFACPDCEVLGKTADECEHYGIIGIHPSRKGSRDHRVGGVFASYIAIPHYCCHRIPEPIRGSVPASLLEPAGNSWEIVRYLKRTGLPQTMAIFGCGPHGLNLQFFARYIGVKKIVAFEVDPARTEFARNSGVAHHVINPEKYSNPEILNLLDSEGFDTAVDMAGNEKIVNRCKDLVRENGEVILFGLPRHESLIAHGETFSRIIFNNESHRMDHNGKNIRLRGFTGRSGETWKELIAALEESELLREKISSPVETIGTLHELEHFIDHRPEHFLKVGLTHFDD